MKIVAWCRLAGLPFTGRMTWTPIAGGGASGEMGTDEDAARAFLDKFFPRDSPYFNETMSVEVSVDRASVLRTIEVTR